MGGPFDLRRRVMGWRAAERRAHAVRAREGPMAPDDALDAALELWDFLPDAAERLEAFQTREIEGARSAWRKIRVRMACRPADPVRP